MTKRNRPTGNWRIVEFKKQRVDFGIDPAQWAIEKIERGTRKGSGNFGSKEWRTVVRLLADLLRNAIESEAPLAAAVRRTLAGIKSGEARSGTRERVLREYDKLEGHIAPRNRASVIQRKLGISVRQVREYLKTKKKRH